MSETPGAGPREATGDGSDTPTHRPPRTRAHVVIAVLAVLVLGACLRGPITSVGPLLDVIRADTGLSTGLLGFLVAMPLLGFALVSPLVHGPAVRVGPERIVAAALVALALGIVLRSAPVTGGLWLGTAVIGCAIAVGNVLAPSIIKRDQPGRIALVTACFTAVMSSFGALGSGLAVPLSAATGGGWRVSLGAWALPVTLIALWWVVRAARARTPDRAVRQHRAQPGTSAPTTRPPVVPPRQRSVWRSAGAWQVTVFMGLQSATFYILVNWLPSISVAAGVTPAAAGWLLFGYQLIGIPAGLLVTRLMRRRSDLRAVAVVISLLMVVGAIGLAFAPGATTVWVVLSATASGSSLVVALSLFGLRSRDATQTAQLSGMAQSIGYLIAAAGPVLAGAVRGWTGSWTPVLGLVAGIGAAQAVVALWAARPGYVQRPVG